MCVYETKSCFLPGEGRLQGHFAENEEIQHSIARYTGAEGYEVSESRRKNL